MNEERKYHPGRIYRGVEKGLEGVMRSHAETMLWRPHLCSIEWVGGTEWIYLNCGCGMPTASFLMHEIYELVIEMMRRDV